MSAQSPNLSQPTFETWAAADGTVITIRPICAADLALEQEFVNGLSAPTGYQRLMSARRPSLEELVRFTDIDCERERALIATTPVHGREHQIGVARYVKESSPGDAEFAIVLSDDWQGRGAGDQASRESGCRSEEPWRATAGRYNVVGEQRDAGAGAQAGFQACERSSLGDDHELDA